MPQKDELVKVFAKIDDEKTMEHFFNEIFTESERKDLLLRWQLMRMLKNGVPQREIASKLRISLCKITRGVKVLKGRNSVSRRLLDKTG
jgi:TrpR family trp operon transcriptional repressor